MIICVALTVEVGVVVGAGVGVVDGAGVGVIAGAGVGIAAGGEDREFSVAIEDSSEGQWEGDS